MNFIITMSVPQLDTEAIFFIPFGYDVSHQVQYHLNKISI